MKEHALLAPIRKRWVEQHDNLSRWAPLAKKSGYLAHSLSELEWMNQVAGTRLWTLLSHVSFSSFLAQKASFLVQLT